MVKIESLIRKIGLVADRDIHIALDHASRSPRFAGQSPACTTGCSTCCCQPVGASTLEVLALVQWLRENKSEGELQAIQDRAAAYVEAHRDLTLEQIMESRTPCPLLDDSLCSAYPVRPVVCRGHHSFDLSSCLVVFEGQLPHLTDGVQSEPGTSVVTNLLRAGIESASRARNLPSPFVTFGIALAIALKNPDAIERWVAGEDVFAAAAVPLPDST